MGAFGQDIPSIKDKTPQEDTITIMIMRSIGRVRSFKISPPFLYLGAIFILLNITATIYFGSAPYKSPAVRKDKRIRGRDLQKRQNDSAKRTAHGHP